MDTNLTMKELLKSHKMGLLDISRATGIQSDKLYKIASEKSYKDYKANVKKIVEFLHKELGYSEEDLTKIVLN